MRTRRKIALVAAGLVAGLCALEIALQIAAYVLWRGRDRPAPPATGQRTVLCVGDSFTHGLGAADPENAYPAVAQRALAAAGRGEFRVVNLGWPGQDSARVLARLPEQLATYRPELVYVLVGYNDFWRAAPAGGGEDPDAFRLEFRTWKLLTMAAAALRGVPAPPPPAPFLGPWHLGSAFFEFRSDGSIDTHEGPFDGVWSLAGERIELELRHQDAKVEVRWRIDGDRLSLEGGGPFATALTLRRGLPDATPLDRGRRAARAGELARAERELRAALAVPELRFEAAVLLARLLVEAGRPEEARPILAAEVAAGPPPARLPRLGDALLGAGMAAEAFGLVDAALRGGGIDDGLVQFVVRAALRCPDPAALDAALAAALQREALSEEQRIGLLGLRAALGTDPTAALDALVEVARLRPEARAFTQSVRWQPERFPREAFVARAQRLAEPERSAVIAAYDAARAVEDETGAGLAANLRRIAAAVRGQGAEAVLMTYPGGRPDLAAVVRGVAAEVGLGLVDHLDGFAAPIAAEGREALFVADGHCSDAGYRLMGQVVADDVLRRRR
jgi:hypothetical protein